MKILALKDVSKAFGGVSAVEHLSMEFLPGRITALIGPNGAGKTTIFNLINGFIHPEAGKILYRGEDITGLAPWRVAQKGVGRLFQDARLFYRMTVRDNVLVSFQQQSGERIRRAVFAPWRSAREVRLAAARVVELLDFVGLSGREQELAENLSFGQQKLLAVARLLAADAGVLLLDEPTAGVNPLMLNKLLDLLDKLAAAGKTVAIIEHNMNVVLERADWAYFVSEGQVSACGKPGELLDNQAVKSAYIGMN